MVYACQRDSFLKTFTSKVISCKNAKLTTNQNGKKETIEGFEVVLEDTILFPEGGGQPWDLGKIAGEDVIQVIRRGAEAVHFLRSPVPEGEEVEQELDWNRRLDHMQQHSGQHLITAIIAKEFGFETSSWWLGEELSYLELDTPTMTSKQVARVEAIVNQLIADAHPVTVKEYDSKDPELKQARTRGLPEDHVGLVRIVTIEGLENNMCCGTHVSNLSQLQMIKLVSVEKGKKGKTKLNFLAGKRVLNKLGELLSREVALTNLLQNKGSMHVELLGKIQDSLKIANKNLQTILRETAAYEAEKLKLANPKPDYFILHRKEADMDFINAFLRHFSDETVLLLLLVGQDPSGQMVLHGKPDLVFNLGPKLCEVLTGKGFGKGPKYQAKVGKINLQLATDLVVQSTQNLNKLV